LKWRDIFFLSIWCFLSLKEVVIISNLFLLFYQGQKFIVQVGTERVNRLVGFGRFSASRAQFSFFLLGRKNHQEAAIQQHVSQDRISPCRTVGDTWRMWQESTGWMRDHAYFWAAFGSSTWLDWSVNSHLGFPSTFIFNFIFQFISELGQKKGMSAELIF
jgi:hypothetical protein